MGKPNKRKADAYATREPADTYGTIYKDMYTCEAFKRLSPSAKHLYACCRIQARSGGKALFKHAEAEGTYYPPERCFVFPRTTAEAFGFSRGHIKELFAELIAAGFIEVLEQNKHRFRVNVYSFSDRWKNSS